MAAKKNTVQTPLHLLQELSQSLLAHLEEACILAQADAEKLLLKLDRQRAKAQEKLEAARQALEKAAAAGKAGAQAKARARIEKLELLLDALKASDRDTRNYLVQLKADIQDSLRMAQQVGKAGEDAAQALAARQEAPKAKAPRAVKPAEKAPVKKAPAQGAQRGDHFVLPVGGDLAQLLTARRCADHAAPAQPDGAQQQADILIVLVLQTQASRLDARLGIQLHGKIPQRFAHRPPVRRRRKLINCAAL